MAPHWFDKHDGWMPSVRRRVIKPLIARPCAGALFSFPPSQPCVNQKTSTCNTLSGAPQTASGRDTNLCAGASHGRGGIANAKRHWGAFLHLKASLSWIINFCFLGRVSCENWKDWCGLGTSACALKCWRNLRLMLKVWMPCTGIDGGYSRVFKGSRVKYFPPKN